MSRPSLRRTPMLETLEIRQVLSSLVGGPTPDQQYALALINLVRTNPALAAQKLTADISPSVQGTLDHFGLTVSGLQSKLASTPAQPPLAWGSALAATAQQHSQFEAINGVQTHQGQGEAGLSDRIASAGYSNTASIGENTYAYAESVDEAMQSFLFDWGVADNGHFNNLLQPGVSPENAYKDVGIGLVNTNKPSFGPLVITQDFGSTQNEGPQIVGSVFNAPNGSWFYAPGQGQSGVTIDAVNLASGVDYRTQSMSAGGFQVPVASNADYQVTATENGHVISSQKLHVGNVNVETDFIHNPSNDVVPAPVPTTIKPLTPVSTDASFSNVQAPQLLIAIPPQQTEAQQTAQDQPAPPTSQPAPAWLSRWSRWTAANRSSV